MVNLIKTENNFSHKIFGNLTTITNEENGDVLFIVKEVSDILGFRDSNELTRRVDSDEILKLNYAESKTLLNGDDIHSSGIQLLTESGLYAAILGSRKTEAKDFKKWVTKEVLPAIRKTGSYSLKPMTYIEALEALLESEKKKEVLKLQKENLEIELDKAKEWFSIKKVAFNNGLNWKELDWKLLKTASTACGYLPKKIFDSNYIKGVNAYHYQAWLLIYPNLNYNFKQFDK